MMISLSDFIKQHVLVKRPENDKEPPIAKSLMFEPCVGSKLWVAVDQFTRSLETNKIPVSDGLPGLHQVPLKLNLGIRDEVVRLTETHAFLLRPRTRSRMPSKSSRIRAVVGLSP